MNSDNYSYQLLDSVSVGICIIDKHYQVQFWNEYLEDYTGINKVDIQKKNLKDFFPGFAKELYTGRIDRIFEGWAPVFLSSRLHEPFFIAAKGDNNKKRFQEINISPFLLSDGDNYLAILTVTDITHLTNKLDEQNELYSQIQTELETRKVIQKKLKVSESNLRELNATKDKMFTIISHDLRNPIATIINFSELVQDEIDKNGMEQIADYNKIINTTAESTIELLDNLLLWSRIQTGSFEFKPVQLKLEHLILQIIEVLQPSASLKNITLNYSPKDYLVFADANMLKTIVRNLLQNAIKFTNPGGLVNINTDLIDKNLKITVSDNGIGMNEETQGNLFQAGENNSASGTAGEKGSGLGLVLCKEFVERHGGLISVQSSEGIGSEFSFTIPMFENN